MKYTSTEKRAKAMGPDAPARKARHLTPLRGKRAKVRSHMTPLTREARESEESADALKGASYQPSRFRRTTTPVVYAPTRGVQLGHIA